MTTPAIDTTHTYTVVLDLYFLIQWYNLTLAARQYPLTIVPYNRRTDVEKPILS
jgi:hypothetical protein